MGRIADEIASSSGRATSDRMHYEMERRKQARERERERAKLRYREKREQLERDARKNGITLPGPGRPRTGKQRETLRPVMVSERVHIAVCRLAAELEKKAYAASGESARVTIKSIVEQALFGHYPELQQIVDREARAENSGGQEGGGEVDVESVFEEIIRRALCPEPHDPENGWFARGDQIAYSLPSPIKAIGAQKPMRLEWSYSTLIPWFAKHMGNPGIEDLHTLVEQYMEEKYPREGAREGA